METQNRTRRRRSVRSVPGPVQVTEPGFGAVLRRLRLAAGLSQEELAEVAGLSQQAVSLLEGGRCQPSWATVRRLARALGATPTVFLAEHV